MAPAGRPVAVHQFVPTLDPHDATGTHTLMVRDILRRAGWRSDIFAEAIHDDVTSEAYQYAMYPEHAAKGDVALYQFTTSSAVAAYLLERELPLILDSHNFTPPELFTGWEPHNVARASRAADELARLAPRALLGLADSSFHARGLRRAGCRRTAVVPVLADYDRLTTTPDPRVAAELAALKEGGGTDLIFVGNVVPPKAQHELVKVLWTYRRLYDPEARLHLLGGTSSYAYSKSLRDFADDLGLAAAVRIAGEISDSALSAYFGAADVFVCLSRHEGFGVPLVEAMSTGVPIVTRDAGAVTETVGGAALVLESLEPSYVAGAVRRVCTDERLRRALVERGHQRAGELQGDAVAARLVDAVSEVLVRP